MQGRHAGKACTDTSCGVECSRAAAGEAEGWRRGRAAGARTRATGALAPTPRRAGRHKNHALLPLSTCSLLLHIHPAALRRSRWASSSSPSSLPSGRRTTRTRRTSRTCRWGEQSEGLRKTCGVPWAHHICTRWGRVTCRNVPSPIVFASLCTLISCVFVLAYAGCPVL